MSPTDSTNNTPTQAAETTLTPQIEAAPEIVDLDSEEGMDISDDLLLANSIARESINSEADARNAIHKILDSVFEKAKQPDDEDDDGNGFPKRIQRALDMRMPREAIDQLTSNSMLIDNDGNLQIIKEQLNTIDSIIVEYLANKIFGSRLSIRIKEHKIVKEGVTKRTVAGREIHEFTCIGESQVQVSVRRNDGTEMVRENIGISHWSAPIEGGPDEIRRAIRVGHVGCVTIARKNALMLLGNVFQCIRDNDGIIDRIKQAQEAKVAQRRAAEAEANSQRAILDRGGKPKRQKPALKVDPALAQRDGGKPKSQGKLAKKKAAQQPTGKDAGPASEPGASNTVETSNGTDTAVQPATEQVAPETTKPAAVRPVGNNAADLTANPFPLFKADGTLRGNLKDAKTFTTEIGKMILKAKAEADIDQILALHKVALEALIAEPKYAGFADAVRAATDGRKNIIREGDAKRAKAAEKKAAKAAQEAQSDAKAAIDAATEQAVAAATNQVTEQPATELSDPAGFGPAPTVPAQVPAAAALPPAPTGYNPHIEPLTFDASGKLDNQPKFGQSALDAINGSPTKADLQVIEQRLAADLAQAPVTLQKYLQGQIERKRKSF